MHVSNMDASGLTNTDFSEEDAAMIKSTRIRVGRNLADYPLGPGVTKDQRLEIMQKVVDACDTFEGDLKGKFYPLEGMTAEDQQQGQACQKPQTVFPNSFLLTFAAFHYKYIWVGKTDNSADPHTFYPKS